MKSKCFPTLVVFRYSTLVPLNLLHCMYTGWMFGHKLYTVNSMGNSHRLVLLVTNYQGGLKHKTSGWNKTDIHSHQRMWHIISISSVVWANYSSFFYSFWVKIQMSENQACALQINPLCKNHNDRRPLNRYCRTNLKR